MMESVYFPHYLFSCNVGTSRVVARVNMVGSVVIPSQKGRIVSAKISHPMGSDKELLFELNHKVLELLGVSAMEAMVTSENGQVCIPIDNFQDITAHLESWVLYIL